MTAIAEHCLDVQLPGVTGHVAVRTILTADLSATTATVVAEALAGAESPLSAFVQGALAALGLDLGISAAPVLSTLSLAGRVTVSGELRRQQRDRQPRGQPPADAF